MGIRFFFLTLLLSFSARAGLVDLSAFYFSDSFSKAGVASTYNRTFYDLTLATPLTKSWYVGWNYLSTSAADNVGAAETHAGTQMGLKFFYFFGRQQMWRLGLAYNLVASSTYSTTNALWKGTGIFVDFGAAIPFSETGSFTLRLNYSSTTYVDEYIDTTWTKTTNTRTFIYPSVGTQWNF